MLSEYDASTNLLDTQVRLASEQCMDVRQRLLLSTESASSLNTKTPINFWIPGGERKPLLFHTFCRYVSGYAQPIIFDEDFSLATCVRLTPMPDTHYRIPVATT